MCDENKEDTKKDDVFDVILREIRELRRERQERDEEVDRRIDNLETSVDLIMNEQKNQRLGLAQLNIQCQQRLEVCNKRNSGDKPSPIPKWIEEADG